MPFSKKKNLENLENQKNHIKREEVLLLPNIIPILILMRE